MSTEERTPRLAPSPWQGEGWGGGRRHQPLTHATPIPALPLAGGRGKTAQRALGIGLQAVAGFETTGYAWSDGRIVWAGHSASVDHPRNATRRWQPAPQRFDARTLATGAHVCLSQLDVANSHGLLRWLMGMPLPFPLEQARPRIDAVRDALVRSEAVAFEDAALRVLGLGHGLTPSGDDFIGAIFFALAHAPRDAWRADMPAMQARMHEAAQTATNAISAALLDDLMAGRSYRALHELLAALQDGDAATIHRATQALLRVGASSGADMLAGLLLALTTSP